MTIAVFVLPSVSATTIKIYPSDDAFVRDDSVYNADDLNFGTGSWRQNLRAGYEESFGIDRSFLKFDLSPLQGETVNSAVFSAFALSGHSNPVIELHHVSNDNWDEETITWNNQPSSDTFIGSEAVQSTPQRIEFNVESYIGENELSLMMSEQGENGFVNFYSKDLDTGDPGDAVFWPYIEVEYEGGECLDGDLDCNGCVSQSEITTYAFNWLNGDPDITQSQVTTAAFNWLNGINSC